MNYKKANELKLGDYILWKMPYQENTQPVSRGFTIDGWSEITWGTITVTHELVEHGLLQQKFASDELVRVF